MATTGKNDMQDKEFKRLLAQEVFILDVTEVLCKIMRDKDISRKQLADLLGKSKGAISQLLNGERNLTLRTVADIFHVLGCEGLLTYKEIQENDENKNNVYIFPPVHVQHKKTGIKWENIGEVSCSDNYGCAAISMGEL